MKKVYRREKMRMSGFQLKLLFFSIYYIFPVAFDSDGWQTTVGKASCVRCRYWILIFTLFLSERLSLLQENGKISNIYNLDFFSSVKFL